MRRLLAAAALLLGMGAAIAGARAAPGLEPVDARELAHDIRGRRPGLVVIDLRSPAAYALDALPTARNDLPPAPAAAGEIDVLYGGDAAATARAVARLRGRGVRELRVLDGGVAAWEAAVLHPRLPADPNAWTARERETAALSTYFGGTPRTSDAAFTPVPAGRRRGC